MQVSFLLLICLFTWREIYSSNFEISEDKVTEVCSYLADTCFKCVKLKSCFWCPDSNDSNGECLANYNSLSRYKCMSNQVYKLNGNDCMIENKKRNSETNTKGETELLVKLLALLKRLHSLKNDDATDNEDITTTTETTSTALIKSSVLLKTTVLPNTYVLPNTTVLPKTTMKSFVSHSIVPKKEYLNKTMFISPTTTTPTHQVENILTNKTISLPQNGSATIKSTQDTHVNTTVKTIVHLSSNIIHKSNCLLLVKKKDCLQKNSCSWNDGKCFFTPSRTKNFHFAGSNGYCVRKTSCNDCVSNPKCYWCEKSKTCHSYTAAESIPKKCKNMWYQGSCSYKTTIFLVVIPAISVLIFLSIAYVCVKNCYYHQLKPVEVKLEERPILFKEKNGRTVYQITESEDDEDDRKFATEKSDLFW